MQEETLKTKPKTVATIEELERLIPLLEAAKEEETKGAVSKAVEKALADERAKTTSEVQLCSAVGTLLHVLSIL